MTDLLRFHAAPESDKSDEKGITKIFKWWNNTLAKLFGEENTAKRPDFLDPTSTPTHGSPRQRQTTATKLDFGRESKKSAFRNCLCGSGELATFGPCNICKELMCITCAGGRRGINEQHPNCNPPHDKKKCTGKTTTTEPNALRQTPSIYILTLFTIVV